MRGGKAHREIVDSASAGGAGLIVMGDAGSGTAQRVVDRAACSVRVVRAGQSDS